TIRECKIHDCKTSGVYVQAHGTGAIERCDIWGNTASGILVLKEARAVIRGCNIHHGKQNGIYVDGRSVVRVEEYSEGTGNAQAGVDVSGEAECTLIRTHVRDNGSWGVVSGAGARVTMESCKASGVWSTGARDGAWLTAVDTQIDGKTCGAYASSKGVVLLER